MVGFVTSYILASKAVSAEWDHKVQPRSMDVRWGVIQAIAACADPDDDSCTDMPNFLPQSLWDNEACAALVRNTLNFAFGEEILNNANAWQFSDRNAEHLTLVYDRSHDFHIDYELIKVLEDRDSGFRLSKLLSPRHVYILGYHYHETRSDPKIIVNGGNLNSHLMLLLPRQRNGWSGFHLVHFKHDPPIRIDRIGFMPKHFDLVYIWRVNDLYLPKRAARVRLEHNTMDHATAMKWLRFGRWGGPMSSHIDTIAMFAANFYHGTTQFPTVVVEKKGDASIPKTRRILQAEKHEIARVTVEYGDRLVDLVADHEDAKLAATYACNPELRSKHLIYTNQVLSLCK